MKWRIAALVMLSFLLGGLVAMAVLPGGRDRLFSGLPTAGKALVGGPFSLVDHTGRKVTDKDFRGRYMLVYFGFTYCPDVCPSGLQVIAAALQKLGPKADRITPIFITVDPERDTPAQLAEYVKSFDFAADWPHRHTAGSRRRRQGLSRLLQESAGREINRGLHVRSYFHHLSDGPERDLRRPFLPYHQRRHLGRAAGQSVVEAICPLIDRANRGTLRVQKCDN